MSRYTFGGETAQTYPQYIDLGKDDGPGTLVADPGQTYDIAQVEGLTVPGEPDEHGDVESVPVELPMPPDDRWQAEQRTRASRRESAEETS